MKNYCPLTADYRLRTDLQSLRGAVGVRDGRAEDHAASRGLLLASSLKLSSFLRESVLDIDITLLQDTDAIARDVLGGLDVDFDHYRAVDLPFHARRGVLAAHAAGLIKHVGQNAAHVGADEYLQARRFIIADQPHDGEAVSAAVLHRASRALRLITSAVLLLGLAKDLQLRLAIRGNIGWWIEQKKL